MALTIRNLHAEELKLPLQWAKNEGWNPGLNDWETFYSADPQGFFVAELDGEPIATVSAVNYDDTFAFCGLYIVKQEYRSKGYGMLITDACLAHAGNRITGGDGVLAKVPVYKRIGYVPIHKSIRFQLSSPRGLEKNATQASNIRELKDVPFAEVDRFDRLHFPAKRSAFLHKWISQSGSHAYGWVENDQLHGYGVIRRCASGHKIGPLFAENVTIAAQLFKELCLEAVEYPIYLDIPEPNKDAHTLVNHFGMLPGFEVMRMYRNGIADLNLNQIYGFTSFELG
jgi:GNAT superfamily N-acetyltransferase